MPAWQAAHTPPALPDGMPSPEPPARHEFHGPPKPPNRIPDGKPNPFYAPHKEQLAKLREKLAQSTPSRRNIVAAEEEWRGLKEVTRMQLLYFAGYRIEGIPAAAQRAWRELPPAERTAVGIAIRELQSELRTVFALTL